MLFFVDPPVKEFPGLLLREKKAFFVFLGYFKIGMSKRNDTAACSCRIAAFLAITVIRIKPYFSQKLLFLFQ